MLLVREQSATIRGLCQVFVSPITAMAIMVTA
jgi:hypothetical protein